ncbi:extracellular solute-binding protein [Lachnospiraceae bacterium 54-53]
MKKRILALILSAAASLSLMTGCGGNDPGKTSASGESGGGQTQGEAEAPEVSITVFDGYAGEDPHGKYIYQYAEEYMAEHPNVTIEIQAISTNDIYTKLSAMAAAPDDVPTLFFTSADAIATLHDLGLTEDLKGFVPEDLKGEFANGVVDSCMLGDEMAYFPVAVQPTAVIYRTDRFKEAGLQIPGSWEEFVDCAKALTVDTNNDGQMDQWGFDMVGSNNSSGQSRFMAYLWSNGIECVKEEGGKWITDISADEKFMTAFSRWTNMNTEGIVPTGITEVDYPTAANYFAMGYTSMFLTGPNALGVAYSNNPDLKGNLGSFKMPGDYPGTMLGTEGYAVSAHATDAEKEAAVDYLRFFVEHDEEMAFWQSSGKIPATVEGQKAEYISGEDYAGFLQQIADGCRPTVTFAGVSGLKSALGNAYASVFSNEKTDAEAVGTLVSDIEELLEDYN